MYKWVNAVGTLLEIQAGSGKKKKLGKDFKIKLTSLVQGLVGCHSMYEATDILPLSL